MSALLPLFPLGLVLFPGAMLPLHIFEPRYRQMIAECLEEKKHFGVVRAKDDGISGIGCTAEILEVAKLDEDGRMDILTAGRRRFEILRVNRERSFLQAEIVYREDEPGLATSVERGRALRLHQELLALSDSPQKQAADAAEDNLAYHLAGPLPFDLDFKQTLLEIKSEPERIRAVISLLESILPALRRTSHLRQKAGGNGHSG